MAVRLLPWKLLASVCSANQSQALEYRSSSFFGTFSAATPPTERMLPPPTLSTSLGNCLTSIARTGTCLCSTERLEHNGNYFCGLLSLLKTAECIYLLRTILSTNELYAVDFFSRSYRFAGLSSCS